MQSASPPSNGVVVLIAHLKKTHRYKQKHEKRNARHNFDKTMVGIVYIWWSLTPRGHFSSAVIELHRGLPDI